MFHEFRHSYSFGSRNSYAMQLCIFMDAFALLTTPQLSELVAWVKKMSRGEREQLTVKRVIKKLEKLGFQPSSYQRAGLEGRA